MQLYVNYYDETQRTAGDNPTLGLILCVEKNDLVVRYTLGKENRRIFASRYKRHLPTEEELTEESRLEACAVRHYPAQSARPRRMIEEMTPHPGARRTGETGPAIRHPSSSSTGRISSAAISRQASERRFRWAGGSQLVSDGSFARFEIGKGQEEAADVRQVQGAPGRSGTIRRSSAPSGRSNRLAGPPGFPRQPHEEASHRPPGYPRDGGLVACAPGPARWPRPFATVRIRTAIWKRWERSCLQFLGQFRRSRREDVPCLGHPRFGDVRVHRMAAEEHGVVSACAGIPGTASWIVASGKGSRMMNSRNVSEPSPNMSSISPSLKIPVESDEDNGRMTGSPHILRTRRRQVQRAQAVAFRHG